jgi:hypothetical protein
MCCCSSSTPSPSPSGPNPPACVSVPCPTTVTVVINLSQPVACPGHPLAIQAVGTPSGGTYAWSISGGTAALVDGAGAPIAAGPDVNLRAFQADDATGKIPAQTATVTVTYTHPNGTATASKPVPIHKIDFEVTDTNITGGVTQVTESAAGARFGNAAGVATMSTDPKVKIKLDPSCPRKADCAANHRVGWLQTMLTTDLRLRWRHTLISWAAPMPIRDIITGAPTFPFYFWVQAFTADNDTQTAHHEDSPGNYTVPWTDSRPTAPAPPPALNGQLRQVFFGDSFNAWLVVQNIEWSAHDLPGSFAYQKNFSWSCRLDFAVDTTQAVGSRCTPTSNPAIINAMSNGKGGSSPNLAAPVYNSSVAATTTAEPAI